MTNHPGAPARDRQITERLAQLYVDAEAAAVEERYQAITGDLLTRHQRWTVKDRALNEFTAWLNSQRGANRGA